MQESLQIDSAFISTWHPQYDEIENDEGEYQQLVAQIRKELNDRGSLSMETFIRVLDWKSPRVKGIARLDEFPKYEKVIAEAVRSPKNQKLEKLCELRGIGAPVGSTLLHLMYPDEFPIIDIRTVETLHFANRLNSLATDLERYPAFMAAILNLASENPGVSLREIDRALFAYHKLSLAPKLKREPVPPKARVAGNANPTPKVAHFNADTGGKLSTHDKVVNVFVGQVGMTFSREEIVNVVARAYPGTNPKSVIPSDYCYNMINKDPNSFKLHGFELTGDKRYKWLGPDHPYSGPIYWKSEVVGKWDRGQCKLSKDPRKL